MALTLTDVQRLFLDIIALLEIGLTTPEGAVEELNDLKQRAKIAGVLFKADYTLMDFEKIRENYLSVYDMYDYDAYDDEYDETIGDENEE